MKIERAIQRDGGVEAVVDGRAMSSTEKYTILEMGYAVHLLRSNDNQWVRENGETIPADPDEGRAALESCGEMLVTSDPVLLALALNSWWHHNDRPQSVNVPLAIPSFEEAVEIVRARPILNDFNAKHAGTVPGLRRPSPRD